MMPIILSNRRSLAIVGLVALFSAAVAEDGPRDVSAFTEAVAVELRQQVGEASVVVKGPLTLGLGDLQLNLDRIFAFCRGNAAGCRAQVDGYHPFGAGGDEID